MENFLYQFFMCDQSAELSPDAQKWFFLIMVIAILIALLAWFIKFFIKKMGNIQQATWSTLGSYLYMFGFLIFSLIVVTIAWAFSKNIQNNLGCEENFFSNVYFYSCLIVALTFLFLFVIFSIISRWGKEFLPKINKD
jgi:membrane protease YdiL (CAAX protease family)